MGKDDGEHISTSGQTRGEARVCLFASARPLLSGMWLRAMLLFFLPGRIRPNRIGVLFMVALNIRPHLWIVRFPVVQMTNKQMMISPSDLAKRNQITRIKLQFRIEVEWLDMVDLQSPALVTTNHTAGFAREMRVRYGWPLWTTLLMPIFTRHRQSVIPCPCPRAPLR